jgi:hypothetical protein
MELLEGLREAFTGSLRDALTQLWVLLEPLWLALVMISISWACILSALGKATDATVGACIRSVFGLVLSAGIITNLPLIVESSIASAGDLAGTGGASTDYDTPLAIAASGVSMFSSAANHATAVIGWAPWSWGILPLVIWATGLVLLACFVLLAIIAAMCLVELLVGAVISAPLTVFLMAPGLSNIALHGPGHLFSCTIRLASISFIASYGASWVESTGLGDMSTELGLGECMAAMAVAIFLAFASLLGDKVIVRSLSGQTGAVQPGTAVWNYLTSSVVSSGTGGAGARGGGGGGGPPPFNNPGGGGGGPGGGAAAPAGRIQTQNTATWARRS